MNERVGKCPACGGVLKSEGAGAMGPLVKCPRCGWSGTAPAVRMMK